MQEVEKVLVEIVQPSFAFEADVEFFTDYSFRNTDRAMALFCEQGIAEDQVCLTELSADALDFSDDVFRRPRAIGRGDPVRTIGAEFRAAAAGKHRERMTRCPNRP